MTLQEVLPPSLVASEPGAPLDPKAGPQTLEFEDFPPLTTLLRSSGLPGVIYLHCHAVNLIKAQKEDFWPIRGVPGYTVKGHPVMLLGKGAPIKGARPESASVPVEVDEYLDELMAEPKMDVSGVGQEPCLADNEPIVHKDPLKEKPDATAERDEVPSPNAEGRREAAPRVQERNQPGDRGQKPEQRTSKESPAKKGPPLPA